MSSLTEEILKGIFVGSAIVVSLAKFIDIFTFPFKGYTKEVVNYALAYCALINLVEKLGYNITQNNLEDEDIISIHSDSEYGNDSNDGGRSDS